MSDDRGESLAPVEVLVTSGLSRIKKNISQISPKILEKLEDYFESRYHRRSSITHEKSKVRVDIYIDYVDTKEICLKMAPFVTPIDVLDPDGKIAYQPSRLNFNKIGIPDADQLYWSSFVWKDLPQEEKEAFIFKEINRMRSDDLATLTSIAQRVQMGKLKASEAPMFERLAHERLDTLERIEKSVRSGTVRMVQNKEDASITIYAK